MNPKLTLLTLGVDDLKKEESFFMNTFRWKKSPRSVEGMTVFDFGGYALALHPRNDLAEDAQMNEEGSGFSGVTFSFNVDTEAEVDKLVRLAIRFGGTVVKNPKKASWGGYSGYVRTPSGHLFEIAYNPYWELDHQGRLKLE